MIKRGPKPVTYKRQKYKGQWVTYRFIFGVHRFTSDANYEWSFNAELYTREEAWENYKQKLSTPNT
jgi:hypothetical protein